MPSDKIIAALRKERGPLGALAKAFPGAAAATQDPHWLDEWFVAIAAAYSEGKPPSPLKFDTADAKADTLTALATPPVTVRVRLETVRLNFFRGYKVCQLPIAFDDDLIVVEGRNSSGKTSLAEGIEWLLTGQLSRRRFGNPRELADCISNEFRPANESTWVEAELEVDGLSTRVRRTLLSDYSDKSNATAVSELNVAGKKLTEAEADAFFERLFAGVAPILMQHTLGQFIRDDPDDRRRYFERLLQLDELTALITQAVIGDPRLASFPPSVGVLHHTRWRDFKGALSEAGKRLAERFERKGPITRDELRSTLIRIAAVAFAGAVKEGAAFPDGHAALSTAHERDRERRFPILSQLRPSQTVRDQRDSDAFAGQANTVRDAEAAHAAARVAAKSVSDAEIAVSRALEALSAAGLIPTPTKSDAYCPLCDFRDKPTLTKDRIAHISPPDPAIARRCANACVGCSRSTTSRFQGDARGARQARRSRHLKGGPGEVRWEFGPGVGNSGRGHERRCRSPCLQVHRLRRSAS